MNMKKLLTLLVAAVLFAGTSTAVTAQMSKGQGMQGMHEGQGMGGMMRDGKKCPRGEMAYDKKDYSVYDIVMKKAWLYLKKTDELGLSDQQTQDLMDLKTSLKKEKINLKARTEIIALDVKSALWSDPVNVEALNDLIDEKYEIKKQSALNAVEAYSRLQQILTDEQKQALKEMWKQKTGAGKGMNQEMPGRKMMEKKRK